MNRSTQKKILNILSLLVLSITLLLPAQLLAAPGEVRLSSTIGPIDAGIVPLLSKTYEENTGTKVTYEGAGTGATLEKAKSGKFDMVIVHAKPLEEKFIAEGYGVDRRDIMYNDFVILGPANDPAGIKGMKSAVQAFRKIATSSQNNVVMVTRGDMSGTHAKELEIWKEAGITPDVAKDGWYVEYSLGKLGNAPSTIFADKRNAYILMDRATFLIHKKNIGLVILVEKDPILLNLIAAIQVNPARFPSVNNTGARAFIDWLCQEEAQTIIKNFQVKKHGEPLFFPNSLEWHRKHSN